MKHYLYDLLARYLSYYIAADATVVEIKPQHRLLIDRLPGACKLVFDPSPGAIPDDSTSLVTDLKTAEADYLVLNGTVHFVDDIFDLLETVRESCKAHTRVLITYYSRFWRPAFRVVDRIAVRERARRENWIAPSDIENLLRLAGLEPIVSQQRIVIPLPIPILSNFVNRWLAPLPLLRWFTLVNVMVVRPIGISRSAGPSVSVIIPVRNEAGNIESAVRRLPSMGPADELIFVEGHSEDDTWAEIKRVVAIGGAARMHYLKQPGRGKADAVRTGFNAAQKELLMILDGDLTVPPEELPKFYRAIATGTGEFINGSRLVYPMQEDAMNVFNILGNKFFAQAFSFLLGQRFNDTLCGTKVMWRTDYQRLVANRAYFGEFDPFGDFDLLFGASKLGLKIVELPIRYRQREYGATNIRRWVHGLLLLKMVVSAARKVHFL